MLLIICLTIVNLNFAFSYPYDPVYHGDYDADHAAAISDIDHQLATLQYDHDGYDKGYRDSYGDSHFTLGGQRGDKGYNSHHDYSKGKVGHYGAEGHKNKYNDKGGHSSGHRDDSNYYKNNHAVVKSSNGNDYAVTNSFNKGSNTKGFHNVYHKEEYQKNKKFYDEANKHGYYRRYGDFGAALLAAAGQNAKGNHYDSDYKDASYGKNGFAEKGSLYDDLKKYAAANGQDGYYGNYANKGSSGYSAYNNGYGY